MSLAVLPCAEQDSDTDFLMCREEMSQADLVLSMICMVDLSCELRVDDNGHVYPLQ